MDKDCDKNDVTSRIPRIDRILAAPTQGSRIPQPNIGKCPTTPKASQLSKPGEVVKHAKASKLNRIPSLRTKPSVTRSNSNSTVPKSIPKSHSNGAISKLTGTGLRPPQRVASKDAIVPDLESLLPNLQAIEDEVLSLVGSTDCLVSGATTPVDLADNNNIKMLSGKLETTRVVDKAAKVIREPSKVKGSKLTKSKLCDKKLEPKSNETTVIATPIRRGTFIAESSATVEKSAQGGATIVLLRRDNTFDILDEKPNQGTTSSKVQETPIFKTGTCQRIRPKMLLLDASEVHQNFDSPLQFNLDKFAASTPMEVGNAKNVTHDILAVETTFILDHTPKNMTQVIDRPGEDMQVDHAPMVATNLIHLNETVNLGNGTFDRAGPNEACPHQLTLVDSLSKMKCTEGSALRPRESFGLLAPQQIERLEGSFEMQTVNQISSLIKFDESLADKTLVPEGISNGLPNEPIDKGTTSNVAMPTNQAADTTGPHQPPLNNNLSKVAANRLSFSKFPDVSLSCSIDLEDITNPLRQIATPTRTDSNSFEMEDSLGILTPDQLKDFGDTTASRPSLDLLLVGPGSSTLHLRVEQTPSPEELPLDPPLPSLLSVMVSCDKKFSDMEKSEFSEMTESKTDIMKSSSHSKGSNLESVITSVTSLDGYQGDGEMSRPASRNAEYKVQGSPGGIGPQLVPPRHVLQRAEAKHNEDAAAGPVVRRPDPMTDSDFFTESDADDIFLRGDRRAQIIDGQLYGKLLHNVLVPGAAAPPPNVMENSVDMESSGIFTDAEPIKEELQFDMSPDDRSTETVQSNSTGNSQQMSQRRSDSSNHHQHLDNESLNAINHGMGDALGMDLQEVANDLIATACDTTDNGDGGGVCDETISGADKMQVDNMMETGHQPARARGAVESAVVEKPSSSSQLNRVVNKSAAKRMNPTSRRSNSSSPPITKKKMVEQPNQPAPTTPSAKVQVHKTVICPKKTPNKWEAVMNKIAQNQSVTQPKNYSEVKSRVNSAPKNRSVSAVGGSMGGLGDSDSEHVAGVAKGYSTISTSNRSSPSSKRPENNTSSSKRGRSTSKDSRKSSQNDLRGPNLEIGSAKKRDVRTINSCDLGPPYKTTTTPSILQTTNNHQPHTPTAANSQNGVPARQVSSAKKPQTIIQKQRANSNQNQPPSVPDPNNNKSGSLTTTPVKANGKRIRNGESPISIAKFPLKENNRLATPPPASAGPGPHHPRSLTGTPPVNSPKQAHRGAAGDQQCLEKKLLDAILLLNKNKFNVLDEAQAALQQKHDSERAARIADMESELHVQGRGVQALGVLVNYLVQDYDAFSNPALKRNYEITSEKLVATRQHLEETCESFRELEHRLAEQESKFQTQSNNLANVEQNFAVAQQRLDEVELERNKLAEQLEMNRKQSLLEKEDHRARTEELESRLRDLTATEHELREKVMASEVEYSDRLKSGSQREKELLDRIQKLEADFEAMRIRSETREQELTAKLEVMQTETVVLRSTSWNGDNTLPAPPSPSNGHPYRHSSPMKSTESNLEVESLRSVLELKMNEVVELRRQNQDLQRAADDLAAMQFKANSLESKVEDLQFQLCGRTEREGELSKEVKTLGEKLSKEQKYRTRLSIHNEELQWKLKQNSERHQRTLQELSKSFHENSMYQRSDDGFDMDENNGSMSPPQASPLVSPKIKGIVETSDAVSWILEMDDDSPGQVASRAIRRVGSFRASPNALKRSKSSQSPMNPLSQSASATSLLRQCSAETSPMKASEGPGSNARSRSKSMSVKPSVDRSRKLATLAVGSPMKKGTNGADLLDTSFQVPSYASSPYKPEGGGADGHDTFVEEKKRAVTKNLSFSRTRAASFGAAVAAETTSERRSVTAVRGCGPQGGRAAKLAAAKECVPLESAGEAMMLNISDGEDGILSANSSLTTSTSSSSTDDEAAEKERTAISIHPSMEIKWSPMMSVEGMDEEEEEEDDCDEDQEDDIFGNSESVV